MPGNIPTRVPPVQSSSARVKGSGSEEQPTGAETPWGCFREPGRRPSGLASAEGTEPSAKFTKRREGGEGHGERGAAQHPGNLAPLRSALPARVVGASSSRTHPRGDAKTRLALCLAPSGAPSEMGSTTASGVRAPRTQPPQAHHCRSPPAPLALQIPDAADLKAVELGVPGLASLPRPTRPATRSERLESEDSACRRPQNLLPKKKIWELPGGNWVIVPVQRAPPTASIAANNSINPGGERRGAGDYAPEGAWSAEKAHLVQTRPSGPFGSLPWGSDPAAECPHSPSLANPSSSFSTRGWTAPRPESARGGFPRAVQPPSPTPLALAVPQSPRRGGQEVRQGFPRKGGFIFLISPGI
ncbi:hypothetical protein HPG69_017744 [Diceros bicornis minor]|uniref:Uncharacterized protein n=1 Tax=Diceros bicornis minor TaxID=77932 RepID=A0A7J7FH26_DICBM|nr:hypothetical protein HPG69_017744 [Diceros bicornis minor]